MKKSMKSLFFVLLATSLSIGVKAQNVYSQIPPGQFVDVVALTQTNLDHLKQKLNLDSAQEEKWNIWSSKVIGNVKERQLQMQENSKKWQHTNEKDMSTPEELEQQILNLTEHIALMQDHLSKLKEARLNTLDFYNALNKNQKTIFDLYWESANFNHPSNRGWQMHNKNW